MVRTAGTPRGSTYEAIVQAAVDCFYEGGYETTSVQTVVERAGVTKGAFYHYFGRKEDLLLHIHDRFLDEQLRTLEAIDAANRSPREVLTLLIEAIVVGAAQYQQEHLIFFEQRRHLSGERFEQVRAKRDRFEQHIVRTIEDGIAQGVFGDVPSAQVLAFGIVGMAAWVFHWYRPSGMSAQAVGQMYAATVLDGITTTPEA